MAINNSAIVRSCQVLYCVAYMMGGDIVVDGVFLSYKEAEKTADYVRKYTLKDTPNVEVFVRVSNFRAR